MQNIWYFALLLLQIVVSVSASSHVVLYKRDTRATIGWVGLIWLTPFVGAFLYWAFGINRIARRAKAMLDNSNPANCIAVRRCKTAELKSHLPVDSQLVSLAHLVENVTRSPLTSGNSIHAMVNGDEAYPRMLDAISNAKKSITLCSFIFERDKIGEAFARHLSNAVQRGVEVRALVDAVGAQYSWPTIIGHLRKLNVPVAVFHPTFVLRWYRYSNLRNHRKLLVIDGRVAFTGGINIRDSHLVKTDTAPQQTQDLHFEVTGPVVNQLQSVFAHDWQFATGEPIAGELWFSTNSKSGNVFARAVSDGPDEELDHLRLTLLGAIDCAQYSIKIITPYFLPDAAIISALNVAALQGISVELLLPAKSNLRLVQWASTATLWQILERGCQVSLSSPPFDHTKLVVVDEHWVLLGSANWDARSLRLNFELNLECYDAKLGAKMAHFFDQKLEQAKPVSLADVDGRHLLVRLRDGFARLLSPYL